MNKLRSDTILVWLTFAYFISINNGEASDPSTANVNLRVDVDICNATDAQSSVEKSLNLHLKSEGTSCDSSADYSSNILINKAYNIIANDTGRCTGSVCSSSLNANRKTINLNVSINARGVKCNETSCNCASNGNKIEKFKLKIGNETVFCSERTCSFTLNLENKTVNLFVNIEKDGEVCNKSDTTTPAPPPPDPKSHLCKHGSKYVKIDDEDYRCDNCLYPMTGKRCDELNCSPAPCFMHKDTVYYMYEASSTWGDAYDKCSSEGMTMAMTKDKETHRLVRKSLIVNSFARNKWKISFYWIGLNRTGPSAPWTWVDGTPLQHFTETIHKPVNHLCTIASDMEGILSDETCTKPFQYRDYPFKALCQKIYPHLLSGESAQSPLRPPSCDPNPCLFGGKCEMTSDQKDVQCVNCPSPTTGKHCEELTCKSCFRINNTIYVLFLDKATSASDARFVCETNNMTLAMIKDRVTHTAIKINLFELFGRRLYSTTQNLWIGLSRGFGQREWTWDDGHPLGNYSDWLMEGNYKCVSMKYDSVDPYGWEDAECDIVSDVYPMCQLDKSKSAVDRFGLNSQLVSIV